jgi:endonuclease III
MWPLEKILKEFGGSFAQQLNIDLSSLREQELFKWFLAAILYGAPIPEKIASKTFAIFAQRKIDSPAKLLHLGWEGVVSLLDEGGYGRYDFKTATKLLEMAQRLQENYGGKLQKIHAEAKDSRDLEKRLQSLAKGIGPLTINIFLRELRGIWKKADPLPSDLCVAAARYLRFIPQNLRSPQKILSALKSLWQKCPIPGYNFVDFEAALVRFGLHMRRRGVKNFKVGIN